MPVDIYRKIYNSISDSAEGFNAATSASQLDTEYRYPPVNPEVVQDLVQALMMVPSHKQVDFMESIYAEAVLLRFGQSEEERDILMNAVCNPVVIG